MTAHGAHGDNRARARRLGLTVAVVLITVGLVIGAWTLLQPPTGASASPPPTTTVVGIPTSEHPSAQGSRGVPAGSVDQEDGAPPLTEVGTELPITFENGAKVIMTLSDVRRSIGGEDGAPPPDNGGYLVVHVSVKAVAGKDIIIRPYRFSARIVETGRTTELSIGGGGMRGTALESVVLQPGQSVDGDIAFDVAATGSIVIRFGNGTGAVLARWQVD